MLSMGRIIIALFFEVVILALNIQTGESIECYVCASNQTNKCADPIDRSELQPLDCKNVAADAVSLMRKGLNAFSNILGMQDIPHGSDLKFACQKIDISDQSGKKHIFRVCSLAKNEAFDPCSPAESVLKRAVGNGKLDSCVTCDTDLCNGASQHSLTIISAFVVPCFAIIISRWIGV